MKNKLYLFTMAFTALLLTSCTSYRGIHYVTNDAMLNGLSEKGDLKASGSVGQIFKSDDFYSLAISDRSISITGQAAWSPLQYFGIQGSMNTFNPKANVLSSNTVKGYLFDLAMGGYYPIKFKNTEAISITVDNYTGYGTGVIRNYYQATGNVSGTSLYRQNRFFNQSGVHIKLHGKRKLAKDIYTFSLGLRAMHVDSRQSELKHPELISLEALRDLDKLDRDPNTILHEWTMRHELGLPYCRMFVSNTFSNFKHQRDLNSASAIVQVGLVIDIGKLY